MTLRIKYLVYLFAPLAFALAGCTSVNSALSKIPANSFAEISDSLTIGPYTSSFDVKGGQKAVDGSMALASLDASMTFMGYGDTLKVSNLTIGSGVLAPTATPAPAATVSK